MTVTLVKHVTDGNFWFRDLFYYAFSKISEISIDSLIYDKSFESLNWISLNIWNLEQILAL